MDARISNWGNDLREFVDRLDRNNDLKTFSGADWNLEIGALTEIGAEQSGPALMFDNIKGYPRRFWSLTNFLQAEAGDPVFIDAGGHRHGAGQEELRRVADRDRDRARLTHGSSRGPAL